MRWTKCKCFRSLRGRLLAAFAVGLLVVVALMSSLFMLLLMWPGEWIGHHRPIENSATEIVQQLEQDADGTPRRIVLDPELQWLTDAFPRDIEFRVVDVQGLVVLRGHPTQQLLPDRPQPPEVGTVDLQIDGIPVQLATVQVANTPAGRNYYLQAAASERILQMSYLAARNPVRVSLITTLLISIPVLLGLMLLALKNLLRPLRETSKAAAHIDPRNLSARLPLDKVPSELRPLINAFNLALERLEHGYRIQQQFLASAAHELKTPLALMRGQIEVEGTQDKVTLLMDIDVMARQVHQLLHLAEVSEAHNYKTGPIAAVDVAVEVAAFLARMADRHMVQIDLDLPTQAVQWQGDQSALFTLLKNVLENAILHSPAGGVVTLSVDADGLSVRDEGPGVKAEHRAHLFERFWRGPGRAPSAPQGAGLGLSICQEIALAHGWQLHLCDTACTHPHSTAKGTLFRLNTSPPSSPSTTSTT
jgi:two-component system sensor histidine kinase QseC